MDTTETAEQRTFRMLPAADIGFARPALDYRLGEAELTVLAHKFAAPEPELARAPGDPGWWTITAWLPVGAVPLRLIPDPDGPTL